MPKFTVLVKNWYLTNTMVLISNMKLFFFKLILKTLKKDILGPKFKAIHFCTKLSDLINLRALVSNMNIIFNIVAQKYSDQAFLVPNLNFLCFAKNFVI